MTLAFDTSILIALERKDKKIIGKLRELSKQHGAPAIVPMISCFEFMYGIQEKNIRNKQKALDYLDLFSIIPAGRETARVLAELKREHEKSGDRLPLADLLIAAQCIEKNAMLVTTDKHFTRIDMKRIVL